MILTLASSSEVVVLAIRTIKLYPRHMAVIKEACLSQVTRYVSVDEGFRRGGQYMFYTIFPGVPEFNYQATYPPKKYTSVSSWHCSQQ